LESQAGPQRIGGALHGDVRHGDLAAHDPRHPLDAQPDDEPHGQEGLGGHGEDQQLFGEGHVQVPIQNPVVMVTGWNGIGFAGWVGKCDGRLIGWRRRLDG